MNTDKKTVLVESVRFYAIRLAARHFKKDHSLFDFDDLVQAAMLGATEAAQNYDINHASGANFLTFAAHPMRHRVLSMFRNSTPVHIPRREYDEMTHMERGKWIWNSQIHLSAPGYIGDDGSELSMESMLPSNAPNPDDIMQEDYKKRCVHEMLSELSDGERWLVTTVFGLNGKSEVKVSEIAASYNVTRQAIHYRLTNALKKMRKMAVSKGLYA